MSDKWAKIISLTSAAIIAISVVYIYGVASHRFNWFPYSILYKLYKNSVQIVDEFTDNIFLIDLNLTEDVIKPIETLQPDKLSPGLLMIAGSIQGDKKTFVRIIDRQGNIIHEWLPDWKSIWGDEGEFPENRRPKTGKANLHGMDILPDGSLVANFEHLSTFKMNFCGDVEWKLDNLGHHAVHYSPDNNWLWVTAERYVPVGGETNYINHKTPLRSWTVQRISVDGQVEKEIEMIDLLEKNDLYGLLYLSSLSNFDVVVGGDTLHLNDIDEFPSTIESSKFQPGDLLVSLRNINTLLVFDPETLNIKFVSTGAVQRQHDPDFMPNDKISIFDNRNLLPDADADLMSSRIVEIDVNTGLSKVVLEGQGSNRFFTDIMGVHQRLANGNILLVSSSEGRLLEYAADGTIVWRFDNRLSKKTNGRTYMAMLLPETMDKDFFSRQRKHCKK